MAYLSINFSSGDLIEQSKTAKEGFEPHQQKSGNTVYRKKHRQIEGALIGAEIKKVKFPDKPEFNQFSLSLKNGEEYFNLQMDVLNQYGAIDSYLENFITKVPNLKKGETYSLSSYSYNPDNSKYPKRGISIKQGDVKIERALSYSYGEVQGDIPAVVVSEKKKLGVITKDIDSSDKTEYLYNVLTEWLAANFPQQESSTSNQPTTSPKPKTREQEVDSQFKQEEDKFGDLPF